MSVRLRLGPFSISSRGRVGARVGPISVSAGGGRRAKRGSPNRTRNSSQTAFERGVAEGDRWFREQARVERLTNSSLKCQATSSSSVRKWFRRGRGAGGAPESEPPAVSAAEEHGVGPSGRNSWTFGDEALVGTATIPSEVETAGYAEFVKRLRIVIARAQRRGSKPPHILISGAPGAAKATLAEIVACELRAKLVTTSGPALRRPVDLAVLLFDFERDGRGVLFIDEVHRMPAGAEEILRNALMDGVFTVKIGNGSAARSVTLTLAPIVFIVGAPKSDSLSLQLLDHFDFHATA